MKSPDIRYISCAMFVVIASVFGMQCNVIPFRPFWVGCFWVCHLTPSSGSSGVWDTKPGWCRLLLLFIGIKGVRCFFPTALFGPFPFGHISCLSLHSNTVLCEATAYIMHHSTSSANSKQVVWNFSFILAVDCTDDVNMSLIVFCSCLTKTSCLLLTHSL